MRQQLRIRAMDGHACAAALAQIGRHLISKIKISNHSP
jgi:hypothetical protein